MSFESFATPQIEEIVSLTSAILPAEQKIPVNQNTQTKKRKRGAQKKPWGLWVQAAKEGRFEDIPANEFIRYYKNIMEIHKDHVHMKK